MGDLNHPRQGRIKQAFEGHEIIPKLGSAYSFSAIKVVKTEEQAAIGNELEARQKLVSHESRKLKLALQMNEKPCSESQPHK